MKKVETKILESKCYKCSGTGRIEKSEVSSFHSIPCDVCKGTGIYKEKYYYFFDEKTKICFSGDTLK